MNRWIPRYVALSTLALPALAAAYVGPGAGLSLLGALWALIVAVVVAVIFLLAWPIRRMRRRKRDARGTLASPERLDAGADEERIYGGTMTRPHSSDTESNEITEPRGQ